MKRSTTTVGRWETKRVFVRHAGVTDEQEARALEEEKMNQVTEMLGLGSLLAPAGDARQRFAAAESFQDYFPGRNKVPDEGGWVMVKMSPPCEYTVPPMSFWFAEPWPIVNERFCSHRVKIITPKGELGMFPREYALVDNPEKYYEFIGQGIDIKFFGGSSAEMPEELRAKLFYIRSRGVGKSEALAMLIGSIKLHGVMWLEAAPELAACFGMEWPAQNKLATV